MNDHEVIDRLRRGLDEFAADIGEAPPLGERSVAVSLGDRSARQRIAPALILGAMATAAVVVFAVTIGDRSTEVDTAATAAGPTDALRSTAETDVSSAVPQTSAGPTTTLDTPGTFVDLFGATWTVVEADGIDLGPGPAPWFDVGTDGSVRGSDACRSFEGGPGTWRQIADAVEVGELTYDEPICEDISEASALFGDGTIAVTVDDGGSVVMTHPVGTFLIVPLLETATANGTTIAGTWTDGLNVFDFGAEGVLRFSREVTCDGGYSLDNGRLDVSFGQCESDAVLLQSPIFRQATAYTPSANEVLLLAGDAGVTRLDRTL